LQVAAEDKELCGPFAALEQTAAWFSAAPSNGDQVDDATPLSVVRAPEGNEPPTICNAATQRPKQRLAQRPVAWALRLLPRGDVAISGSTRGCT
jgi:hypothetical protein